MSEREKKQLELLEYQINDEEYMFGTIERTQAEIKRIEEKKRILNEIIPSLKKEADTNFYHIPDSYEVDLNVIIGVE